MAGSGANESATMPESVRALTGPTASAFAWIGDRSSDLVEHAACGSLLLALKRRSLRRGR